MSKDAVTMKVDPKFRDLLQEKSTETGFSMTDLTRLAARGEKDLFSIDVRVVKPNKKRNKLRLVENDGIMDMFK